MVFGYTGHRDCWFTAGCCCCLGRVYSLLYRQGEQGDFTTIYL